MLQSVTWVSILVQVLSASEGKPKTGRKCPGSPLAHDHLGWLFLQTFRVSIIDVDQSLLVLSSKRTAYSHVFQKESEEYKYFQTVL